MRCCQSRVSDAVTLRVTAPGLESARGADVNELQSAFLKMVVPAALESERLLGVPASITIAQAILESGWGRSGLAQQANNFFGMKAGDHAAPDSYVEMPTQEVYRGRSTREIAKFARYVTPADSFKAHACLLAQSSRYRPAMAVRHDPAQFALELRKCGYSTNPLYEQVLMHLVDCYDLTQYDTQQGSGVRDQGSENERPAAPAGGQGR